MNRTRALSLLFFLGSTAFSQTTGKQAAPESLLKQFSSATLQANCPIQLKAGLYLAGEVRGAELIENGRTTERRQRIHITLANPEAELALAQLTVYGFPVGSRVDPAVAYASHQGSPVVHNHPAEIQKMIAFDRAVAAGQSTSIDIPVRDFSIVSSIDLNSVTYSDGSSWHPANHKYCQAVGVATGALPIDGWMIHR
jgi:hypothetical protein